MGDWVVRPGKLMVRRVDDPPNSWRWAEFHKPIYFHDDELVSSPRYPTQAQVWRFKRDGVLYAIAEYDFYKKPERIAR